MSRRALFVLLVVVAGGGRLIAQNEPFLGIWELNLAKSSITRGMPPRSEAKVIVAEPGGFRETVVTITDGAGRAELHHFNFDGNPHQTEGSDPREMSFKRVSPLSIDVSILRNGQVTADRRVELSQDGKTLTETTSGTSGGGQRYTNDIRVYDKK